MLLLHPSKQGIKTLTKATQEITGTSDAHRSRESGDDWNSASLQTRETPQLKAGVTLDGTLLLQRTRQACGVGGLRRVAGVPRCPDWTVSSRRTPETLGQGARSAQVTLPGLRENGFCVTLLVKYFT